MTDRRPRDKDKTTQAVLSAAAHLFSEKGLHGTSMRDIEQASGVSKGLILHHFGSKESLYAAVQDHLSQEYSSLMASQKPESGDLRQMIAYAVRSAFSLTKGNRAFRRINLWAYLEGQQRTTEFDLRLTTALIEAMRSGQKAGVVREDIDPFLMPFIIKGSIEYWLQKSGLIEELVSGDEKHSRITDDELITALTRLFTK